MEKRYGTRFDKGRDTKMFKNDIVELKVSGSTMPNKLGSAIVRYLKEVNEVCLTAMGDTAVNVAVKSIVVAQSFIASEANEIDIKIGFATRFDDKISKEVTLIAFYLKFKR